MPFGKKPRRDGTERLYDFDKVYRVLIQRAILEAGLRPIRADEKLTSAMIHTEMFKDLRDQPVVLADLSLGNPNVFYELGIRHVMSSSGTVLICCKGMDLPFDVNLSRVVFYEYDGLSLDWEEVERTVEKLRTVLQEAQRGDPDSPVHALLESVLSKPRSSSIGESQGRDEKGASQDLEQYQRLVAESWKAGGRTFSTLFEENGRTAFGARALGYYCLGEQEHPASPSEVTDLAKHLVNFEQYDLANLLFKRLRDAGQLDPLGALSYASSYSEEHDDFAGAEWALALVKETQENLQKQLGEAGTEDGVDVFEPLAHCLRSFAELQQWKWQLTKKHEDLESALAAWKEALGEMERARSLGGFPDPGLIAQGHLKTMLLLRVREDDRDRPDVERHSESVLGLRSRPGSDKPAGISYLNWYQAITLADQGDSEYLEKAWSSRAEDEKLAGERESSEIGRRQYVRLRRFIEQYSHVLRHRAYVGRISQILQAGQRKVV